MKTQLLTLSLLFTTLYSFAQVGIGTDKPDVSAVLDIVAEKKGVLVPRMTNDNVKGITTPAEGLLIYNTDKKCLQHNVGTSSEAKWYCLFSNQDRTFYAPSIELTYENLNTEYSINLYDWYEQNYNSPKHSSTGINQKLPVYTREELNYHITAYDGAVVKVNSIDANGLLKYEIIAEPTSCTFVNVVFEVINN